MGNPSRDLASFPNLIQKGLKHSYTGRYLFHEGGIIRLHRLAHQRGGQIGDEGRDRQHALAVVSQRSPLGEGVVFAKDRLDDVGGPQTGLAGGELGGFLIDRCQDPRGERLCACGERGRWGPHGLQQPPTVRLEAMGF